MNNFIEVTNLSYRYETEHVLENIDFTVPKGAFLGLVGPNGSGKSTLLKIILGLLKVQTGEVRLFGTEISRFKQWERIAFVSQKANSFNSGFPATVNEVVLSGLTKRIGLFKRVKKEHLLKVQEAIDAVGLTSVAKQNIGKLSGGQQQRVFIARALVSNPELLILDEPTVGVDAENVQSFYDLLEKLNKDNKITLILVTHDIGTITDKVTHVACLNKHLHFHGFTEDFNKQNVSKLYGHDVQLLTHDHPHSGEHQHLKEYIHD